MAFEKIRTIRVSERVFDIACEQLSYEHDNGVLIDGWLETFNNCREQGFVLHIDSIDFKNPNRTEENLYIWACESRGSDEIMVIWSTKYPTNKGMFSEEDYDNRRTYFHYNELQEAANFIVKLVKEHFANEFAKRR